MQTQDRPVRVEPTPKPPVRRKWLIPALAAAVAVIIAVAVPILLLSGGSESEPDVVQPATTVTAPTPSAPTPLEIVEGAYGLYGAGDVEGWQALWAPDATWELTTPSGTTSFGAYFGTEGLFDYGRQAAPSDWNGDGEITVSDIDAQSIALFYAIGGNWHPDCIAAGSNAGVVTCLLSPTTVFGVWEQANLQRADQGGASGGTATISMIDGRISHYAVVLDLVDHAAVVAYQDGHRDYAAWLQANHAEEADGLLGASVGQLEITPDNYQQHRELIADWSTQP